MRSTELAKRIGAVPEGVHVTVHVTKDAAKNAEKNDVITNAVEMPDVELTGVASFAAATSHSLVFVEHPRYLPSALASAAGAIILPLDAAIDAAQLPDAARHAPSPAKVLLRVANPRLAFALAAAELRRADPVASGVDSSAVVHPSAQIHPTASVASLAVVAAGACIGARTHLGPGCVVGPGVVIGADCDLVARVVVHAGTTLGDRVTVKAGAVLGSDGFGFVPDPATGQYHKFPQIGRLEIGSDVEIGANTTIDRGALDSTVIADGVKLDNLVQVAHNVRLGRNVVVASQTGISGSSVLEDNVLVGGQVGIAEHVRIEQGVILGAQCGVPSKKVVRGKGILFWGTPARPIAEYLKELATLARLTKKKKSP